MKRIHSLLKRQIRKYFNDAQEVPAELQGFLELVNDAYFEFDTDRNMLERSLELSSQELLQANTEMRVIFEAVPDLFFRLNYDGMILDCKTSRESDLYTSRRRLIGRRISDVPSAPAARKLLEAIEELKRKAAMVITEYSLTINGQEYFYEARLVPALENEFIAVIRNVSERKMAETALKDSEEKYRSVVEGSHVGVYIVQENIFRFVNSMFCEIHGYPYEEIVDSMGPEVFIIDEGAEKGIPTENARKTPDSDKQMSEAIYRIRRKDGEIRTIKTMSSMTVFKGKPARIGTLLDISKETALEEQLVQSQKLETIGRLTGGIAHDFNNMLGVILGNAQLAMMNLPPESEANEFCLEVEKATHRAAEFTHQLLAFSRRQVLEMKIVDLNEIVSNFEKMVQHIIGEKIDMRIDLRKGAPHIKADSTQLNQILLNLVVNAREAMTNGGKLNIATDFLFIDERNIPLFRDVPRGQYAMISITDTGVGMDKEMLNMMYEPFFTTKTHGTGLGLSVVYGIVKQHGGFIDVYSHPGLGTTFKVYFPCADEKCETVQQDQIEIKTGSETILIIEDDDEFRKIEKTILEKLGYQIHTAADGILGIELFREKHSDISLVIIDLIMPKLDGLETREELKKIDPGVQSLFITGYGLDGVQSRFDLDETTDILHKPFTFNAISQKVREVLDRRKSSIRL